MPPPSSITSRRLRSGWTIRIEVSLWAGSSERKELLQLIPRRLPAIFADLERLRVADFSPPFFTIEFDQSVAVVIRLSLIAPSKFAANLVAAPLPSGGVLGKDS